MNDYYPPIDPDPHERITFRRNYDFDLKSDILKYLLIGEATDEDLAERFMVPKSTVSLLRKRLGIPVVSTYVRPKKSQARKWPEYDISDILRHMHLDPKEICSEVLKDRYDLRAVTRKLNELRSQEMGMSVIEACEQGDEECDESED